MTTSTPCNFKCPNLACKAEYVAIQGTQGLNARHVASNAKLPFFREKKGLHIHDEAASLVKFLSRTDSKRRLFGVPSHD